MENIRQGGELLKSKWLILVNEKFALVNEDFKLVNEKFLVCPIFDCSL
jgi:hypothetical protein